MLGSNAPALALYESLGFTEVRVRARVRVRVRLRLRARARVRVRVRVRRAGARHLGGELAGKRTVRWLAEQGGEAAPELLAPLPLLEHLGHQTQPRLGVG